MRIAMFTNTYLPHVGGVARSVETLREDLKRQDHEALIVAPVFDTTPKGEQEVIRVPALQRFNGSDFSVRLPIPGLLRDELERFDPHIVHSHHPFLLGDTALRAAGAREIPLVFTHHTMYEHYTHYVPGDSPVMRRFAVELDVQYCNLCDHIIAPSESVADVLKKRGVSAPITSIPTGVDVDRLASGDGAAARRRMGIPAEARVIGHVGRLAEEKNLGFLAEAMAGCLEETPDACALIVGGGPSEADIRAAFKDRVGDDRLHMPGVLSGDGLMDAYAAMDVFAFASKSETQGMVLAEAMAAGVPVVALDAPGARELVRDGENGRLLKDEDVVRFAAALREICSAEDDRRCALSEAARATADSVSRDACVKRIENVYSTVERKPRRSGRIDAAGFDEIRRALETEWRLWSSRLSAAADAFDA